MPANTKPPLSPMTKVDYYNDRNRETQWIRDHAYDYPGEWVALDGDRLVAHSFDVKEVFAEVDRAGVARPLYVHLEPDDRLPELGGW